MPAPRVASLAAAAIAVLATAAVASAMPTGSPGTAGSLTPERFLVGRTVLPNGLIVLTHEDHSVPTVAFWQWYRVGSRDERPGITGISHYFEHMMFNGSAHVPPKLYDQILESNGGDSNAFTDRDETAYYEEIASDRMGVPLRLDADRMASLSLLPAQLKSEIEVVKEERRLRVENDIAGLLDEQLYATAFVASPYHWPVLGWMKDLDRIARPDMVAYFRIHYAPDNCILALCGDFQTAAALDSIRADFGPIARQPAPGPPPDAEPEQQGERRALVHHAAENVSLEVGWKAPTARSADAPALDVLAKVLAGGESTRLHQGLVYERRIAIAVSAGFDARIDPSLFTLGLEMKPGHTAAEGERAAFAIVDRLAREGPTTRELQKAKNLLQAEFVEALKTNNGVAGQLASYEHVFGDWREMFREQDRIRAVTAADCRRVAKATFVPERRTVVELVPEAAPAAAVAR